MAGSINFGGLASGLDTQEIIKNLLQVDSMPLARLEKSRGNITVQRDTFTAMESDLLGLKSKMSDLKNVTAFDVFSASSSDEEALSVSASTSANEGNYSIKILSLAQAKALSGNSYEDTSESLGYSGEIVVNSKTLKIRATDSLIDIRNAINTLDVGVKASILKVSSDDNRLIINSENQGENGFRIASVGDNDLLTALGFSDGTKEVREINDGKVVSAGFTSANSTIGSTLGLSSTAIGTIKIQNKQLEINLSVDTLASIRDKINDLSLNNVSASINSETTEGETLFTLEISGTEDFTDDGNILETLGIFAGGTLGVTAEFSSSAVLSDKNGMADENKKIINLGGIESETISIFGTDGDGNEVSDTLGIDHLTKIEDLLTAIEDTFAGEVTASIQNGRIFVTNNDTGDTQLTVRLRANNENGGTLDLGTFSTVTAGRERLLYEGRNAKVLINNISVERSTNSINDVLPGLSLILKKTDVDTAISITVERDVDEVKATIEAFVETYNEFVDYVNKQSDYDMEEKVAGPLNGDLTSRTVMSRIRNVLQGTVFNGDIAYNQLVQVGIESTSDGKLSINNSKLDDAISEDVDSLAALFVANRTTSDNDISFLYHSRKSKEGTYDVEITQAAEQAIVTSDAIIGDVGVSGVLTLQETSDRSMSIDYTDDMSLSDIANSINEEAGNTYAEIKQSANALIDNNNQPITQNTEIANIAGLNVSSEDTITVHGTNRAGKSYSRLITFTGNNAPTIDSIIEAVESINSYQVNASVDADGRIQLIDKTTGKSNIDLTIETTIEGLDFGEFGSIQHGRDKVNMSASIDANNNLSISHDNYGSSSTITVSGGASIGLADGVYKGIDIAGTINGSVGTGSGQALTASENDENVRGMVVRSVITADELALEGSSQGTITLLSGIAERLFNEITALTDPIGGFLQAKIDSLDYSIKSANADITSFTMRIEQKRVNYTRKFTSLEMAMARLQSLQQRLTTSLSTLPNISSFG